MIFTVTLKNKLKYKIWIISLIFQMTIWSEIISRTWSTKVNVWKSAFYQHFHNGYNSPNLYWIWTINLLESIFWFRWLFDHLRMRLVNWSVIVLSSTAYSHLFSNHVKFREKYNMVDTAWTNFWISLNSDFINQWGGRIYIFSFRKVRDSCNLNGTAEQGSIFTDYRIFMSNAIKCCTGGRT